MKDPDPTQPRPPEDYAVQELQRIYSLEQNAMQAKFDRQDRVILAIGIVLAVGSAAWVFFF